MSLKFNFRFNLHKPSSDTHTQIYLIYHFKKGKLNYSIGEKIVPRYWCLDTQRPLLSRNLPKDILAENRALNNKLSNIETELSQHLKDYNAMDVIPEIKDLQNFLNKLLKKNLKPVPVKRPEKTMIEYYEEFVSDIKNQRRINLKGLYRGKPMSKDYGKTHATTITHLKKYQLLHNDNKVLKFEDITLEWYSLFVEMLQKGDKAFNTIGCHIKNIKNFLRFTYGRNLHTNTIYQHPHFMTLKEHTDNIYLDETELESIYSLDLTNNTRLEIVRDLFLIGCYTSLRYSDFRNIKSTDVIHDDSGDMLEIKIKKTGKTVLIPLMINAVEIMKKYDWNLPKAISNQKFNVYIKEIGKMAGIEEECTLSKTYNNKQKQITKPKYQLISSHTARRSFLTNMYLYGFNEYDIMTISGHANVVDFRIYIKADSLQKARKLLTGDNKDYFLKSSNERTLLAV